MPSGGCENTRLMKLDDLKTLRTAAPAALPPQSISEEILLEKYAKGGEQTIDAIRRLAAALAPALPADNFRAEPIEQTTFPDGFADVAISSAVLHFARDDAQFEAMLAGSWRVLASGGMFFCRLASTIGIESQVEPLGGGRRYRLPDGTARYLADEPLLMALTERLGGRLLDPLKTTVVQGQRSMTTWVVRKD